MGQLGNERLRSLELAVDYLQQIRLQLIRCDSVQEQTVPTLERMAQVLAGVRSQTESLDRVSALQTLASIRMLAARAQVLLDAAANFHCGAALAGPVRADSYAPDGTWQTVYPCDQICLNA